MNNVEKFFDEINNKMKYLDPYKWLLDIEIEDIPEVINEIQEDVDNLLQSMQDYDGDINEHDNYVDRTITSIQYKNECIEILKNLKEDYDNEQ